MKKGKRWARERALQSLFAADVNSDVDPLEVLEELMGGDCASDEGAYAREIVRGVTENVDRIDEIISEHMTGWRLERIAGVERNVMRIAVWEGLISRRVPVPVAVDEAVEIAKKYGTEESGRFVNGVLGRIFRGVG